MNSQRKILTQSFSILFALLFLPSCVGMKKFKMKEKEALDSLATIKTQGEAINKLYQDIDKLNASLKQVQDERDQLKKSNDQLSQALNAKKGELNQMVSTLTEQKQALEKQVATLTQEKEELEAKRKREVEALQTTYDGLVSGLQKEIQDGQVKITQLAGKLSVSVAEKIFFDSGRAEVKESGRHVLLQVADVLKKLTDKQILIQGHTDNVPIGGTLKEKYPTNWELSVDRATHVVRFLQEKGNVPPEMLVAAGYSSYRPIAPNESDEGRSQNRRIEIVLIDKEAVKTPEPIPAATPAK